MMATRLCHDLSGAAGTLLAALEMASEDPAFAAEATSVARDAARALAGRLRLSRAAWGVTGEAMPLLALRGLAGGLAQGRRAVTAELDGLSGPDALPPEAARLLVNLLLLAAESMPHGGIARLDGPTDGDVVVTLEGRDAAWPAGLASWLADTDQAWRAALSEPYASIAAHRLQGPLTALLAHRAGLRVSMLMSAGPPSPAPPLLVKLGRPD